MWYVRGLFESLVQEWDHKVYEDQWHLPFSVSEPRHMVPTNFIGSSAEWDHYTLPNQSFIYIGNGYGVGEDILNEGFRSDGRGYSTSRRTGGNGVGEHIYWSYLRIYYNFGYQFVRR
jgi:hypothetical protein